MYNTVESLLTVTRVYNKAITKLVVAVRTNAEVGIDSVPSHVILDIADKLREEIQEVLDKELTSELDKIFKA